MFRRPGRDDPEYELSGVTANPQTPMPSAKCMSRRKYIMNLLQDFDNHMIEAARTCSKHRLTPDHTSDQTERYLTEAEWQQLLQFASREKVTNITVTDPHVREYPQVLEYLRNAQELPRWRSVYSCMLYMDFGGWWEAKPPFVKALIACAESIMVNVEPIKRELETLDDQIHVLKALRYKMEFMQSLTELLNDDSKDVKDGFRQQKKLFDQDAPRPINVVEAYPNADTSTQAVITAVTILVLVSSVVPIALAWPQLPNAKGSIDEGFHGTLLNTLLQLLSLFTMLYPLSKFASVAAWRLCWMLGTASALFSITALILYPTYRVNWSFVFSYFAAAAQSVVVLQVMLGSSYVINSARGN